MADYLTSEQGFHMGFAAGASLVGVLLVVILLLPHASSLVGLRER